MVYHGPMKSLKGFFLGAVAEAVRETAWFQSAPLACQASATFKIIGVESREFRSVIGARQIRPALLVECRCGELVGTFSLLLQELGEASLIGEEEK